MQKLLLTSRGTYVTDGAYELFDKPRNQIKWTHIITAGKSVPNDAYLEAHRQRMRELGWDFRDVDLAGKNEADLRRLFKDTEAIFMEGGNTFYLLKAIRESGFEKVLRELLARGVVYAGSSAGAYVACPTIEAAAWKGDNKFNCHGVTDFTALNLVPFLIFAHYTPALEAAIGPKAAAAKYPVKRLTDQQAIIVTGETSEVIEDENIKSK